MRQPTLVGSTFGFLSVIGKTENGNGGRCWICQCTCGQIKFFNRSLLQKGNPAGSPMSCGCKKLEAIRSKLITHGHSSRGLKSPEWQVWCRIREVCRNPRNKKFPYYGGRGIKVCDRWLLSFADFLADMGRRPSSDHSIGRIDNNGNYEPSNCRWETDVQQANNKRSNRLLTFNGETLTMGQWSAKTGLDVKRIWSRINRNWSVERTLTTPV